MMFGKLGLGFVTTFMSEYLIGGFTTGVAVQVLTSQAKLVVGLKIERPAGLSKAVKVSLKIMDAGFIQTTYSTIVEYYSCLICMDMVYNIINMFTSIITTTQVTAECVGGKPETLVL